MGEKLNKILEEYNNRAFQIFDRVVVPAKMFFPYRSEGKTITAMIASISDEGEITLQVKEHGTTMFKKVKPDDIISKYDYEIGINPFPNKSWMNKVRKLDYDLEGILLQFNLIKDEIAKQQYSIEGVVIPELNNDPYVFDKDGNKQYYQRGYVWTLEDKQKLINSIYNDLSCGEIVVRERGFDWLEKQIYNGNKEVAFYDIIDGKQRLNCVSEFVNDGFTDSQGNYFSDFSKKAKRVFMQSKCFAYKVLQNATDKETLETFVNINTGGVHVSDEHLQKVSDMLNKS